jgi:hypothetical protein
METFAAMAVFADRVADSFTAKDFGALDDGAALVHNGRDLAARDPVECGPKASARCARG